MSIDTQIIAEIYKAFEAMGAEPELLFIIGSINDTMDDEEILFLLEEYNSGALVLGPIN